MLSLEKLVGIEKMRSGKHQSYLAMSLKETKERLLALFIGVFDEHMLFTGTLATKSMRPLLRSFDVTPEYWQ